MLEGRVLPYSGGTGNLVKKVKPGGGVDLKNVQDWRSGEKQEAVEGWGEDGNRGRGSDLEAGRAGGTKCQKDPARNRLPSRFGTPLDY